jgi:hypothetical protein
VTESRRAGRMRHPANHTGRGPRQERKGFLDQEFAEPVTLSSTPPARSPLPRTAARWSFDLLAPRARRNANITAEFAMLQAAESENHRKLRECNYAQKYPQKSPIAVESVEYVALSEARGRPSCTRPRRSRA